ncbi:MAG TPA: MBL fold metallo-hydrolase [Bryobacteraceae bacterium]|jgi:glyoxylase-like metal-dependent hydrolase (beta-lactamase superfamily II)|nr:MBL fold metallo-hydrolase [Bryobacteraceae bacterium]
MVQNCLAVLACGTLLSTGAFAEDAKTVVDNAVKTMGLSNLGSMRYSGSGLNFALGQAVNPSSPWPKFNVKRYERVIDFDAGASSQTMVRTQGENPPRGGGQQPIVGEQTQTAVSGFKQPWSSQFEVWVSPVGFLKGAMANAATVQPKTIGGKKYSVVSYQIENKYKINGYINDQNLVEKVDTWVDNPVLGDMPVEATYSDYKEFHGIKFPGKILETEGGYPFMDLTITDANRNVVTDVQAPAKDSGPQNPIFGVDEQLVAEDVYYFTGGTHHSVIVNFNDYVVVIEGPLDEARSSAVISEVKKLYFNKPIKYLINTHAHFDHAGGIRTYAAEGATILTYQTNKPYYEKTFAMPRTLAPDKLLQSKKKAVIEAVGEKKILTDGTHTIELYHIPNEHNEGMLIAYLPKEKIVVEADLYTPGAANAPTPNPVSPYTVALVDNLDRLKLNYDKILGLHGRMATKDELLKAAGRTENKAAESKPAGK